MAAAQLGPAGSARGTDPVPDRRPARGTLGQPGEQGAEQAGRGRSKGLSAAPAAAAAAASTTPATTTPATTAPASKSSAKAEAAEAKQEAKEAKVEKAPHRRQSDRHETQKTRLLDRQTAPRRNQRAGRRADRNRLGAQFEQMTSLNGDPTPTPEPGSQPATGVIVPVGGLGAPNGTMADLRRRRHELAERVADADLGPRWAHL